MLRTANINDATGIARCHVRSWQEIYRGHLSDEYLDNLDPKRRAEDWTRALADQGAAVTIYESNSTVLGFVCLVPSRDSDAIPGAVELAAIYVDPDHWREGIGRTLVEWVHDWARERGTSEMTLWVLRENEKAKAFYAQLGWEETEDRRDETIGGTKITESRYRWKSAV